MGQLFPKGWGAGSRGGPQQRAEQGMAKPFQPGLNLTVSEPGNPGRPRGGIK